MSLTVAILMMIMAWLLVAAAMLWGVLRITRRHHHPVREASKPGPRPRAGHTPRIANAH